ncbi:MAG: hypothetical protein KatS3mg105_4206 [Gemmatales bacterium]|nr:MAG: hypothetical protein KatS3mg105_4206 [Gemmatales bacterium]
MNSPDDEVVVLAFDVRKTFMIAVPLIFMLVVSLIFDFEDWLRFEVGNVATLAAFALCLFLLWIVLPRCCYLRLQKDGFEIRYLVRKRFFPWDEVRHFRVPRDEEGRPLGEVVIFDLIDDSPLLTDELRGFYDATGYHEMIPAIYGISADEMQELLNSWREKHMRARWGFSS